MWLCVIAGSIAVLFLQDHLASEANALTATTSLGHYHSPTLSSSPLYSLYLYLPLYLPLAHSLLPSLSLSYIIRTKLLCPLFPPSMIPSYWQCFHTKLYVLPVILSILAVPHSHGTFFIFNVDVIEHELTCMRMEKCLRWWFFCADMALQ